MVLLRREVCAHGNLLVLVVAVAAIVCSPQHAMASTRHLEATHRFVEPSPPPSSFPSPSLSSNMPCSSSSSAEFLGFARLERGVDYLGSSLDHKQAVELRTCLQDCVRFPGHSCFMVLAMPAAPTSDGASASASAESKVGMGGEPLSLSSTVDCWLKDATAIGNPGLTAVNSGAQAFVMPCLLPDACGSDICVPHRADDESAVSCTCSGPQELGFVPHPTNFKARFHSDNMYNGYMRDMDPYDCVAKCKATKGCLLAVTSPSRRECFLKADGDGAIEFDQTLRVFASACAMNASKCALASICEQANPSHCIDPATEYGFYFEAYKKDFTGAELWSGSVSDQAECVQRCAEISSCTTAQTAPGRQYCWLKNSLKDSFSTGKDQVVFWKNESAVDYLRKSCASALLSPWLALLISSLAIGALVS